MKKKQNWYIYLFSAGHLCSDINQGALPAMLPFFISKYHFSYATAAALVLAANIVSSIVQPLFGQLTDKKPMPWLMGVGLLLAGGGMAAAGLIPNFAVLCVAVMVSGIGIAAFHPEAARMANKVSDNGKKGTGVGIFSFGGNVGFALGPIISTISITAMGLKGTLILLVPAVIMFVTFISQTRRLKQIDQINQIYDNNKISLEQRDQWIPFTLLTISVFGRSVVFYGLNTFLSLYWIHVLQQSESVGNAMLSVLCIIGAMSTLIGGKLADRFGFNKIIRIGFTLLLPSLFLLTLTKNVTIATLMLIPIGFALYTPYSPMVVLGQKYLPNRLGLASGVTLGLAVSVGGITAPFLGRFADSFGLLSAMHVITLIAIIPAVMSYTLPNLKKLNSERSAKSIEE